MQIVATGVFRMTGVGDKGPYDFAQLMYLKPIEPVKRERMELRGFGFEVAKCDLSNEALEKFNQCPFPCRIEIDTDTVPGRNGFRTIVIGFKLVQAQPKAA
jgi:hypothetical protein